MRAAPALPEARARSEKIISADRPRQRLAPYTNHVRFHEQIAFS